MNRGSINSYTLNAPAKTGGAIRVAADLIGRAFITAQAMVFRRLTGPVEAAAQIGPRVGRRMTRVMADITIQAVIDLTPVRWARSVVSGAAEASIGLLAKAGRRVAFLSDQVAQIDLIGRVFRRQPVAATGDAETVVAYTVWKRAVTTFTGVVEIGLTPVSFSVQLIRQIVAYVGQATTALTAALGKRQPVAATGEARIALFAGVQNDFAYDEDAPEDRTFIVAGEDNIFYVVS